MVDEPEIIREIEETERTFVEQFLGKVWESHERSEVDVRLDWCMEKIRQAKRMMEQNDRVAEARKLQIEDWRQGENRKLENRIGYFEWCVRELMPDDVEVFQDVYGKKSRDLPFGTVGFRQQPDKIEVYNEEQALAWAKLHKLPTKIKETVSKTELKKAIKHTADPPVGFQLVPGSSEFFVTVRTDDTD